MKIELKNIKHFYALSDETNAFSAKLYVNDVLTAECSDTGKGGCMDIHPVKEKEALLAQAEIYAKSLPAIKTEFDFDLEMDLELLVGNLVSADLIEDDFRKTLKKLEVKNIVFGESKKELKYTWFTVGGNKKANITEMLSSPIGKKMLTERIAQLKKEGHQIFNTNIPEELLNNIPKPDNESEKK
ncbi:hypothetical protein [Dysgonomonas sp. ZJ709]|uniref:hypothetical protein n=1 Tax=Dysgonomonas sp. ZJ709 TaxID=2709797 RepID=UPI0013E9B1AB|nr:hypothetical protein [Dysgonomonas sp. ZJ709]